MLTVWLQVMLLLFCRTVNVAVDAAAAAAPKPLLMSAVAAVMLTTHAQNRKERCGFSYHKQNVLAYIFCRHVTAAKTVQTFGVNLMVLGSCWLMRVQIAAAEAAAKAEAQEVEGWKRDATAVLAALDNTQAEKITEVFCPAPAQYYN